jgi:hypothetical protein
MLNLNTESETIKKLVERKEGKYAMVEEKGRRGIKEETQVNRKGREVCQNAAGIRQPMFAGSVSAGRSRRNKKRVD